MTSSCEIKIIPSQTPLTPWQKNALNWLAHFQGGRDVVIAIDLTESVGYNDGTQIRLRQIVENALKTNDSVYIVPFASTVNPNNPTANPLATENSILFQGKSTEIDQIIQAIPRESEANFSNTDIQAAELYIYQELAQINQCRLNQNLPIKPQSVIWVTDAPLLTQKGITSDVWIETPADSPFRNPDSPESQRRQDWLNILPIEKRSLTLDSYQLTVIDIPPTVQEFCTPTPGGKETCLVNPYLLKQIWLPTTLLILFILSSLFGLGFALNYWQRLQQKWYFNINFESTNQEPINCYLAHKQRITIGSEGIKSIPCPGSEIRGYLERHGLQLYLIPTGLAPIYYRSNEINTKQKIESNYLALNCPENGQDFYINIKIKR